MKGVVSPFVIATSVGVALVAIAATGCWSKADNEVVVYAALDREFSEPILKQFTAQTGIQVSPVYDKEAQKTVGLTNRILAEQDQPSCDVFWNNEILNTLRLQREGLLTAYQSPAAEVFPNQFRSPDHLWHGFASRARVLIVNTDLVEPEDYPTSIHDLSDPHWQDRVGIAKPLFGTTASHAACLFAYWGEEKAKQFFRDLGRNAKVMSGNKSVALAVSDGALAFGLTDTDDAIIEVERGRPVTIIYPDQVPYPEAGEEPLGTLFIPNTLAVIRGGPNTEAAKKLVDYLLSPAVEKQLAEGISAQIPLNPNTEATVRVKTPQTIRAMSVDFDDAAEHWDTAAEFLRNEFGQ